VVSSSQVLRDAGLVDVGEMLSAAVPARPEPLMELDAWLERIEPEWTARLDSLERHLRRTPNQSPRFKGTPMSYCTAHSHYGSWSAPPVAASSDSNATSLPTRDVWDAITNPARIGRLVARSTPTSRRPREGGQMEFAGRGDGTGAMTCTILRVERRRF